MKSTRVIILDDDPFTLAMTKKVVRRFAKNEQIRSFSAAMDALSYLETSCDISEDVTESPGIILSDLNMPNMDGFEFLDEFAKLTPVVRSQYRVFILSSTSDAKDRARLFEKVCFEGFYSKPLTPEKFMDIMKQAGYKF